MMSFRSRLSKGYASKRGSRVEPSVIGSLEKATSVIPIQKGPKRVR